MKTFFDIKNCPYTGSELAPLRNYLHYGLLGDSVVSWVGSCRVEFSEMVDGEDVRAGSTIASDEMLHFVIELFNVDLACGVVVQRLFAEMLITELKKRGADSAKFERRGDDVFFNNKKLNISIATRSINSVLIHIGVNVQNAGTPIPTAALSDFGVKPQDFAQTLMTNLSSEWLDILDATYKVRGVST